MDYNTIKSLLKSGERGKDRKMGKIQYNPYYHGSIYYSEYRDNIIAYDDGFRYRLWDTVIFDYDIKRGYATIQGYPSRLTVDRLEGIARYYNLPLTFRLEDRGEKCTCNNYYFWLVEVDFNHREIKISIVNSNNDVEIIKF